MQAVGEKPPDNSPENRAFQARPWLVKLAEDYMRGVDEARQVALLPEVVVTKSVEREAASAIAAVEQIVAQTPLPPEVKAAVAAQLRSAAAQPGVRADQELLAKARLEDLDNVPQIRSWLLWIRQAALVRAWASLEAFMEDVWIETLNRAGREIRQGAFSAVAKSKELDGSSNFAEAQLKIGLLAKYDFNLQNKLGTVLSEKCSFKTVDGIGRAYKVAFGWKADRPTPAFPDPVALRRVEWKRHAIVHRGGMVDSEYAGKANLDDSVVGTPLALTSEGAVADINTIQVQGGKLISGLLLWLEDVEPAIAPAAVGE